MMLHQFSQPPSLPQKKYNPGNSPNRKTPLGQASDLQRKIFELSKTAKGKELLAITRAWIDLENMRRVMRGLPVRSANGVFPSAAPKVPSKKSRGHALPAGFDEPGEVAPPAAKQPEADDKAKPDNPDGHDQPGHE